MKRLSCQRHRKKNKKHGKNLQNQTSHKVIHELNLCTLKLPHRQNYATQDHLYYTCIHSKKTTICMGYTV